MSNSSKIEQYVRSRREAFDTALPGAHCWPAVEKTLDRLRDADPLEQYLILQRLEFDTAQPADGIWLAIAETLDQTPTKPADPLEAFIKNNRDAFDTEIPDSRIWAAIEQDVPAKTAKVVSANWRQHLMRAAAAIVLLIAGINIGIWYGTGTAQAGMSMSDVSTEYAELEQYYQRDITSKQNKLTQFAAYSDKNVLDDLRQMDGMMNELREELAHVPPGNREQVVRAMIENYKAKAAILERVLEHIEQQQEPNQQQQVPTNSSNYEVENL